MILDPSELPVRGLVVLIGAAGAGKTTLAARLFDPSEVVSSDDLREAVSGDAADQRATRTAFGILHREVRRRLAAGRLVVVDATNVEAGARKALLRLARDAGAPASAIVILAPAEVVHARNAGRAGRVVPPGVVDRHLARLDALGRGRDAVAGRLRAEGFAAVHVVIPAEELEHGAADAIATSVAVALPGAIVDDRTAGALLDDAVDALESALGAGLVGIYLSGSAVVGGYDAGVSDIDMVVVTAGPADQLDLARIDELHQQLIADHPSWVDRLEIVYIGRASLRAFRTSRTPLAVISPGEPFHVRDEPVSEWLQNWYLLRDSGLALRGPAASRVVPPIAWAEFVAATTRYARRLAERDLHGDRPGAIAYAVLTMCRAAMTVVVGRAASKQEAAAWVARRLPDRAAVIDQALRSRSSGGIDGFEDAAARAAAAALVVELGALIDDASGVELSPP